jgi:hypothetical protein
VSNSEVDITNKFMVGGHANGDLAILNPPQRGIRITNADALLFAAYIVSIADPLGEKFAQVLDAVQNT